MPLKVKKGSPCRVLAIVTAVLYCLFTALPVLGFAVFCFVTLYFGSAFVTLPELNLLIIMLCAYVTVFAVGSVLGAARSHKTLFPLAFTWIYHLLFQAGFTIYLSSLSIAPDSPVVDFLAKWFVGFGKIVDLGYIQAALSGVIALLLILTECKVVRRKRTMYTLMLLTMLVHAAVGILTVTDIKPVSGAMSVMAVFMPLVWAAVALQMTLFYGTTLFTVLALRKSEVGTEGEKINEVS